MSLDITPAESLLASPTLDHHAPTRPMLSKKTLWIMSAACGATVANTYYNQPLLSDFAKYFHATEARTGLVATAAQVGYGTGLLFLVPLGDLIERRRLVIAMAWLCAALLGIVAIAPTLWALIALTFVVGIVAVGSQILIPLGLDLTPPESRGNTVGILMTGVLVGILLARTVAGFLGEAFGWRAMYATAAVVMVIDGFVLLAALPHHQPSLKMSYGRLMHSMIDLLRSQPKLWTASVVSGLSFAGFMAFWTALSYLMRERFNLGSTAAGLFGIVGVIGAAAAPLAGKLSDRRGPSFTVTLSLIASAVSFAVMWVWVTIPSLIVGVLLMDVGVQSLQVASQSEVISLVPSARSRVNTLYMVARFMGGAAGSAIGAISWSWFKWPGVCGASIAMVVIATGIHVLIPHPSSSASTVQ